MFVIIIGMLQVAGTGALWAMLLAGAICVATAFIYAELSSAWPIAAVSMSRCRRSLGREQAS